MPVTSLPRGHARSMGQARPMGHARIVVLGLLIVSMFCIGVAQAQITGDRARPKGSDPWAGETVPTTKEPYSVMRPGDGRASLRHRVFMQEGVPLEYRGLQSPFPAVKTIADEGNGLYQDHCAKCHGSEGFGDGKAGSNLFPSPALLSRMVAKPGAVDGYLLWTISDGGERIGTDMPAFRDVLSENEIWKIIAFMRAGFPQGE